MDTPGRGRVKVGILQPAANLKEDPWGSQYDPANVRPKVARNIDRICDLLDEAGRFVPVDPRMADVDDLSA